jgi:hypothetical protein
LLKTVYVTVPLAWKKLDRVEESVAVWPTLIEFDERVVAIAGLALFTVRGSHDEVAGLLFASPE